MVNLIEIMIMKEILNKFILGTVKEIQIKKIKEDHLELMILLKMLDKDLKMIFHQWHLTSQ